MLTTLLLGVTTAPTPVQAHMTERKAHRLMWQWYRNSGAKCVHEHEGSWTSNTGNGYYGGYQMGLWFQVTYAPHKFAKWGTANHWTAYWQTVVTHKVVTGRNRFFRKRYRAYGWSQWSTAYGCGLM